MDLEVSWADSSSLKRSIFFGQQNTRRRTVRFGDYPDLGPGNTECVHGYQPESLLK